MNEDVLVKVDNVSKKFCRSLKRSLFYGLQDIASEMIGRSNHHNNLRKNEFWAVKDVSFELRRGECLGLIGHNGAGKSTLLRMLNGLIKPDKGQITIKGRVGALIQLGAGFNPILTGRENVYVNGQILGFTKKEIDKKFDAIVDFSEIGEFIDTPVQNYSSGMKVRLGFAVASQMEPDVLLIDEVLAVGDVGFRIKCYNKITQLINKSAVIFVSHSMPAISRVSTFGLLMQNGKIDIHTKDIATVIQKYFDLFEDQQMFFNSDYFEILSIEYFSGSENMAKNDGLIIYNENMDMKFKIRLKNSISDFNMGITFLDKEQKPVASTVVKSIKPNNDVINISVKVPTIQLAPGNYNTILIFSKIDKNFDRPIFLGRAEAVKSFKVIGIEVFNQSSFILTNNNTIN